MRTIRPRSTTTDPIGSSRRESATLRRAPALPRGVAYLALSAPAPGGEWLIRGAMSQSDLSSWIVAGSFASKPGSTHRYDLGLSYSTQDYQGGNPAALAAVTDGSRNVGELYAFDQWSLNSAVTLDYGARYAHYDYLQARGLLSPRFGIAVEALPNTTIRATWWRCSCCRRCSCTSPSCSRSALVRGRAVILAAT